MQPFEPGKYYHIYNRANGFEKLFLSDENYRYFLRQYVKYIEPVAITYAWCLLPNHFHFLIKIRNPDLVGADLEGFEGSDLEGFEGSDLEGFENLQGRAGGNHQGRVSRQFSNLFNSYSKAFNKMYNRKGSLFMRSMKRKVITSEEYLKKIICYIHHNPVHHGLIKSMEQWKFSSYSVFVNENFTFPSDKSLPWVPKNEVIAWFDNKSNFIYCHQNSLNMKLWNSLE